MAHESCGIDPGPTHIVAVVGANRATIRLRSRKAGRMVVRDLPANLSAKALARSGPGDGGSPCTEAPMHTVYLLQSIPYPNRRYIGRTTRLEERLAEHNRGSVDATRKNCPWTPIASITFADSTKAEAFERDLKSGAGRAWAGRHLQ